MSEWKKCEKFGCYYLIEDDVVFTVPMLADGSMDEEVESSEVTDPVPGFYEEIGYVEKTRCCNCGEAFEEGYDKHHCSRRCYDEGYAEYRYEEMRERRLFGDDE